MPPNITPPLILNYNASTVPIIQLALAGKGVSEQAVFDIAINTVRTPLVTVPGAAIPFPFGGKFRQIQIDLDPAAMQARGLSANDVASALAAQNLLTPVGTQKIGGYEYAIQLNNAPSDFAALADLPIFTANGAMVYPARRRPGARRQPAADQHRACRRRPLGAAAGAEERLGLDARHHRRHQAARRGAEEGPARQRHDRHPGRPVAVRRGRASAAWRSRR